MKGNEKMSKKENGLSSNRLYNYIILVCGSVDKFAQEFGCTPKNIYKKLKNFKTWTINDIEKSRVILGLTDKDIFDIFFK